jgi:outer membrane receptor protein involved in Fe transport
MNYPSNRITNIISPRSNHFLGWAQLIAGLTVSPSLAFAQAVVPAPPEQGDETIVLAPFEVNAELDTGYMAMNTVSGSRLNTRLADTPASISVFTSEFLDDIAATSIADLAKYSSNTDFQVGFVGTEANGNNLMSASQNLTVRGLPTSGGPASGRTVNFLSYPIEIDTYNTDRVDFSRGPNSILFGLGQAGGTFNIQSRTGDTNRRIFSTSVQTGSWDAFRATVDANFPLIKDKLAIRFDGVVSSANGWRPWEFKDNNRAYLTLRYQPTRKTTIDLQYETVDTKFNSPRPYLGPDHITAWLDAGRPMVTGAYPSGPTDPVTGLKRVSTTPTWHYIYGGDSGVTTPLLVNFATMAEVVHPVSSGLYRPSIMPDSSILPKETVLAGSGTYNSFDFNSETILIRHQFTPELFAEVAANGTKYDSERRDINGPDLALRYDPNTLLLNNPGGGAAASIPNPNAGKPYVQGYLQRQQTLDRRRDIRGTVAYKLDLGRIFGNHQLAALGEYWDQKSHDVSLQPVLFGSPSVPNNPENASNLVWQRTYVDLNGPVENIGLANFEDVTLPGVAYIPRSAPRYNRYYVNSWMIATQSKFWNDRLVLTLGRRGDYLNQMLSTSVRDPNPVGGYTVGFLTAGPADKYEYSASTRTIGGVFHVTNWIAVYANRSDNIALPSLNQFTLPADPVPSPKGKTEDFGVMFNLLGGRITSRITYYQTAVVDNSRSLGTGNVQDRINNIWSEMLADGKLTQQQYDSNIVRANAYNFDNTSEGWEGEIVANVTPAWRLMMNVSTNKTQTTNVGTAVLDYVSTHQTTWAGAAGDNADVAETLQLLNDWVAVNLVPQEGGEVPLTADWTANLRTNYSFRNGWLKGFDAGLGARTRIGTFLGYYGNQAERRRITADPHTLIDANISYTTRIGWRGEKHKVKVQLNVNNLFDNDNLIPLFANPDGDIIRYRFETPRELILRVTFDY